MNLAVVKILGKQYLITEGSKIKVANLGEPGEKINLKEVLLAANGKISIGKPILGTVEVSAKILKNFTGPKIKVVKFKPKSRYLRLTGARQKYSEIEIAKIELTK